MVNTFSEFFTDEDLESQLRVQFEYDEMWNIDFQTLFNQIEDVGDYLQLKIRNRTFLIDKITADITEKGEDEYD